MYDRFTDRVRKLMALAHREAQERKHDSIGSEHILLALLQEGSGVAANVLQNLWIDARTAALEVERLMHVGSGADIPDTLPRTPDAERAIQYAMDEARTLNHNYVGTEHLLAGLLRETEGLAAHVLASFGLKLDAVRAETARILQEAHERGGTGPIPGRAASGQLSDAERQFFLSVYRSAVDFYQPRIEKRTGVVLGPIAVWDYARLHRDVIRDLEARRPWPVRILRRVFLRRRLRSRAVAWAAAYADRAQTCAASYYRNAIYVSFNGRTAHEHWMATTAVHELAHALWERLEGEPFDEKWQGPRRLSGAEAEKFQLLVEGYATYGDRVWFLDLYPVSARSVSQHWAADHDRGFRRIKKLVQEHGAKILLEIPRRWREL